MLTATEREGLAEEEEAAWSPGGTVRAGAGAAARGATGGAGAEEGPAGGTGGAARGPGKSVSGLPSTDR